MASGIAAAALIASVVVGVGMTAPAFAKHGNGNGGGRGGGASFDNGSRGFTMGQRGGRDGGWAAPGGGPRQKDRWGRPRHAARPLQKVLFQLQSRLFEPV